jgi:hypothetical protein
MNNEPVAWILGGHLDAAKKMPHLCRVTPTQEHEGYIPLYTHPTKTLTDEEIEDCYPDCGGYPTWDGKFEVSAQFLIEFARAILRKAQENERK